MVQFLNIFPHARDKYEEFKGRALAKSGGHAQDAQEQSTQPCYRRTPGTPEVHAELEHILGSEAFKRAHSLGCFLRYVVEKTLDGKSYQIKEKTIGEEALGRGHSFDQRTDGVVRVQAIKLRNKLTEYYLGPGLHDPVFIELPKGAYVPGFRFRDGPESRPNCGTLAPHSSEAAHGTTLQRRTDSPIHIPLHLIALSVLLCGCLWRGPYGLSILLFILCVITAIWTYLETGAKTYARLLVAMYVIAAGCYLPSAWTMPELTATVINMGTLRAAPVYVFVAGLRFIPVAVLVLGYWTAAGFYQDSGLRKRSGL